MSVFKLIGIFITAGMLAACASSPQQAPAPKADAAPAMAAVSAWASAWQARDVWKYLGAYAPEFKPEKGTRDAWQAQRKERLAKSKDIKITLSDIQIKSPAADRATATFLQTYKSDSHSDKGVKVLDLKLVGGKWLITREYMP